MGGNLGNLSCLFIILAYGHSGICCFILQHEHLTKLLSYVRLMAGGWNSSDSIATFCGLDSPEFDPHLETENIL